MANTTRVIDLESFAATAMDRYGISGIIAVMGPDGATRRTDYGLADRTAGIPFSAGTQFNIASVGKVFTAVLVMRLVEAGRIDLTASIDTYVRPDRLPGGSEVTVAHLLNHTSGLTNYMDHPDYETRKRLLTDLADIVPLIRDMPRVPFSPGERFTYSNSGFIVLGRVIEAVTGARYAEYLHDELLAPLAMVQTAFRPLSEPPVAPLQAIPHFLLGLSHTVAANAITNPGFSDGGIYASVPDLLRFGAALQRGVVSPHSLALMTEPRVSSGGPGMFYGLGLEIYDAYAPGRGVFGHNGGGHGTTTDLLCLPGGYTVVSAMNVRYPSRTLMAQLVRLLLTGEAELPPVSAEALLGELLMDRGPTVTAADVLATLARASASPSEPMPLLRAAESLALAGLATAAGRALEVAVQVFPAHHLPWIHLADQLREQGDPAGARLRYERARELAAGRDERAVRYVEGQLLHYASAR